MATRRDSRTHPPEQRDPRQTAGPSADRLGPRPLAQHIALAAMSLLNSRIGLALLRSGSLASRPGAAERLAALRTELDNAEPDALATAVDAEARRRLASFLAGVDRYRQHPYRRSMAEPPLLWQEGTTRLLDHGGGGAAPGAGAGGRSKARRPRRSRRPALLVVPSLINRGYVLDLMPGQSFVRFLAGQGFRTFLVDWDRPGPAERGFGLTEYIAGRLEAALDVATAEAGGAPVVVIGYCMGGLLALALAARRRHDLAGLVLLATPWDFHAERPEQARLIGAAAALYEPLLLALGELPVDAIQMLFTMVDPYGVVRKFRHFAALDPASARTERFVALEDWLNDGVPLAAPVARECLAGWYGANTPARGDWRVAGRPVRPEGVELPSLVVLPARDRIVPPASAAVLARALPRARSLNPDAGHIGMVVGAGAEAKLGAPLAEWLAGLAA